MNYTRVFSGATFTEVGKDYGCPQNTMASDTSFIILPWGRSLDAGNNLGGMKFDINLWNESYFERFRLFLQAAKEHGIIVEVTLFSSAYDNNQ